MSRYVQGKCCVGVFLETLAHVHTYHSVRYCKGICAAARKPFLPVKAQFVRCGYCFVLSFENFAPICFTALFLHHLFTRLLRH